MRWNDICEMSYGIKNNTYICNLSKINTQSQKYFDSLVSRSSSTARSMNLFMFMLKVKKDSQNMIILKQALNCGKAKASKQVV